MVALYGMEGCSGESSVKRASGRKANPEALLPELAGVAVAGLAARQLARKLDSLPVKTSLLRAAIAAGGTAAVGAALRRRFAVG